MLRQNTKKGASLSLTTLFFFFGAEMSVWAAPRGVTQGRVLTLALVRKSHSLLYRGDTCPVNIWFHSCKKVEASVFQASGDFL